MAKDKDKSKSAQIPEYSMLPWMQTASGSQFWPLSPRAEDVNIDDIAHALGQMPRFGGHARYFYSVAEHAVLCSLALHNASDRLQLLALLHDAAEAYIMDLPAPIKKHIPNYEEAEHAVQSVIYQALGIEAPNDREQSIIKDVDTRMLATEYEQVMVRGTAPDWGLPYVPFSQDEVLISYFSPLNAGRVFLRHYRRLAGATLLGRPVQLNSANSPKNHGGTGLHVRT